MLFLLLSLDDGSLLQVHEMKHGPADPLDVFFPNRADPVRKGHAALVLDPSPRLPSSLAHKLVGRCKSKHGILCVDSGPELQAQLDTHVLRAHETKLLTYAREIALLRLADEVLGGLPGWAMTERVRMTNEMRELQRTGPPRVPLDPELVAVAGCEIPLKERGA